MMFEIVPSEMIMPMLSKIFWILFSVTLPRLWRVIANAFRRLPKLVPCRSFGSFASKVFFKEGE
jgi:hypothetical protein